MKVCCKNISELENESPCRARKSRENANGPDLAHHCVGNHPANRIMKDFYHPNFQRLEVPAILGLSASPIVKSKPNQLRQVSN